MFKTIRKWIRIVFTKKKLMTSKKSQFLFNQIFKPMTKKEIKKDMKKKGLLN
jgi:hypothetical protein